LIDVNDPGQAILPGIPGATGVRVLARPGEMAKVAAANMLVPRFLSAGDIRGLPAFPGSPEGRPGAPERAPRRLAIARCGDNERTAPGAAAAITRTSSDSRRAPCYHE